MKIENGLLSLFLAPVMNTVVPFPDRPLRASHGANKRLLKDHMKTVCSVLWATLGVLGLPFLGWDSAAEPLPVA
ncbi:MAG TPA: hypothetical protein VGR89_12275, partial [Puia sp.]|nr:hypothetical protein [Puia sp.]